MYIKTFGLSGGRGRRNSQFTMGLNGGDARDKLISSRRPVTDARNVIRQQKVSKIGDLRAVLPRSRGISSNRGRGPKDLRLTLGISRSHRNGTHAQSKPELVYAGDEVPGVQYLGPANTNVTVGRGGRVTISRKRGRSIDRDNEKVQPTGIPAHMRRQPSPPPRPARAAPPPDRQAPAKQMRSYPQPSSHVQSYIVGAKQVGGGRVAEPRHRGRAAWSGSGSADAAYEYRHRSRSPVGRTDRAQGTYSGNMRGYDFHSGQRFDEPPLAMVQHGLPTSEHWELVSAPVYRDGRMLRDAQHSLSPPREYRNNRQPQSFMPRHSQSPPYQPPLRMDRATPRQKPAPRSDKPAYPHYQQRLPSELVSRSQATTGAAMHQRVENIAPPQQMYYCIKVTSLSHEVSEEDVVELFSDIGPLVSAKLITKGHAEVCFVHKKDAKTAIEKYDRRELDGIPMNLKLIEKSSSGSRSSKSRNLLLIEARDEDKLPIRSVKL